MSIELIAKIINYLEVLVKSDIISIQDKIEVQQLINFLITYKSFI